jgi:enoyl-CoA hydratase
MGGEALSLSKDGGVAEVRLLGPGKGNAMGPEFFRELGALFEELDSDEQTRVVVLRGSGDDFSYGLDLKRMMGELGPLVAGPQMAKGRSQLHELIKSLQSSITAVERCRKPTIAAVHGWCIGGGLDLIAACDVRLCAQNAKFSLREVRMAIVADLGSLQRLPRIIGEGHTRELAFTGKDVDAERARSMALVNEVYPSAEALFEGAHLMARSIAENPSVVVQGIKHVMNYGAGRTVEEGLSYVAAWNAAFLQSEALAEAFAAFAGKRAPRFQ